MSTVLWENALQGVTPAKGGSALPPATYRLKAVAGEGKETRGGGIALELQFEVVSGPLQGRKQFHNENLPSGSTDTDKTRMAYFLGLMDVYGITGAQLAQMFAGQPITVQTVDYIAKHLVSTGKVIRGTARPQQKDPTRINLVNWTADEGPEPAPPAQGGATAPAGGAPGPFGGGAPQGAPGGFPGGMPGGAPGAPPNTMPLGGFPGSGGMQPNPAPEWANAAPAAQPQAAGLNQFTQPAAAQQPPAQDQGFPGQQFPGQVNPAQFPPQGQQAPQTDPNAGQWVQNQPTPGAGFAPQQPAPGQMPGIPQGQPGAQFGGQPQGAPGLPTGGFPQTGAPQASF